MTTVGSPRCSCCCLPSHIPVGAWGGGGGGGGPTVSTQTVVERELGPLVLGQDPFEVERLWRLMAVRTRQHGRRGLLMHAIAGVDIALSRT